MSGGSDDRWSAGAAPLAGPGPLAPGPVSGPLGAAPPGALAPCCPPAEGFGGVPALLPLAELSLAFIWRSLQGVGRDGRGGARCRGPGWPGANQFCAMCCRWRGLPALTWCRAASVSRTDAGSASGHRSGRTKSGVSVGATRALAGALDGRAARSEAAIAGWPQAAPPPSQRHGGCPAGSWCASPAIGGPAGRAWAWSQPLITHRRLSHALEGSAHELELLALPRALLDPSAIVARHPHLQQVMPSAPASAQGLQRCIAAPRPACCCSWAAPHV